MELNWNFWRGGGGSNQKTFYGKGMDLMFSRTTREGLGLLSKLFNKSKNHIVTHPIMKAFRMQGSTIFDADTSHGPTSLFSSCILLSAIFAERVVSVHGL